MLQELVKGLHRQAAPWLASGLGTRLDWTSPVLPAPGNAETLVISTCKLNQVVEHRAGDFTVTVQAGHPLVELQARLAEAEQWLPVDWPWGSGRDGEMSGSVGGLVARGLWGGRRARGRPWGREGKKSRASLGQRPGSGWAVRRLSEVGPKGVSMPRPPA